MSDKSDHDLLIEIATQTKMFNESFVAHLRQDAEEHAQLGSRIDHTDKSIGAAHRRIDWLLVSGVLAVIALAISIGLRG